MAIRSFPTRGRGSIVAVLFAVAIFLTGYQVGKNHITTGNLVNFQIINQDKGQPQNIDFSLFWQVWKRVTDQFPDKIDVQKAVYGAISGAVRSLDDPYTDFFTPQETIEFQQEISGSFEGIGIEIGQRNNKIVVIAPLPNSPAAQAGLLAGDQVTKVDDKDLDGLTLSQVVKLIRGPNGTAVNLEIIRGETKPKIITVKRQRIDVPSLELEEKTSNNKTISIIKLAQFSDDTSRRFSDAASKILISNPKGIILDLRNDPGGYFDTAVDIASYFIDSGPVAQEGSKDGKPKLKLPTVQATLKKYPLIVLINKGSASASEIVAGAIQDYHAGVIMGETSFGKGTIQNFEKLPDGSSLKITVGQWLTAKGRAINHQGITPDEVVKDDSNTSADEVLDAAVKELANK